MRACLSSIVYIRMYIPVYMSVKMMVKHRFYGGSAFCIFTAEDVGNTNMIFVESFCALVCRRVAPERFLYAARSIECVELFCVCLNKYVYVAVCCALYSGMSSSYTHAHTHSTDTCVCVGLCMAFDLKHVHAFCACPKAARFIRHHTFRLWQYNTATNDMCVRLCH